MSSISNSTYPPYFMRSITQPLPSIAVSHFQSRLVSRANLRQKVLGCLLFHVQSLVSSRIMSPTSMFSKYTRARELRPAGRLLMLLASSLVSFFILSSSLVVKIRNSTTLQVTFIVKRHLLSAIADLLDGDTDLLPHNANQRSTETD